MKTHGEVPHFDRDQYREQPTAALTFGIMFSQGSAVVLLLVALVGFVAALN